MKRTALSIISMAAGILLLISCTEKVPTDLTKTNFIPQPVSVTATGETFKISDETAIAYQEGVDGLEQTARYLAGEIRQISGFMPDVKATRRMPREGISLSVTGSEQDSELGEEGYILNIGKKVTGIKANSTAGVFYGIQSLLQILPVMGAPGEPLKVATGVVRDFPEYTYRGAMLDVSRHFFGVADVQRFIDFLARYKMNVLHLHLSDDQGWRIEIKSWPRLAEVGGSTEVGGGEGGYYSREQFSEIVEYAQNRHITIVPEIDMPGHTNAALASYAELNCDGKATELYTGTKVGFSTLCTRKEITYQFVDDVVGEIAALNPGPWFHIGGDESHVTDKEDYIYFVNRVQKIVESHGKKVIGWDEIAHASLKNKASVQFWSNTGNTIKGIGQGAKVIMSPANKVYLDMKYDSTTHLGLNWAGYIEADTAYIWDPATLVPGISRENIRGIEAPLWTETITNMDDLEYMVFPRLPGYAEIGWTAPEIRDWNDYKKRIGAHGPRMEARNIDFYRSPVIPWEKNKGI